MRMIKCILAVAVILAMVGWGLAATVTQMPGGTHSWTQGSGATAGWAHSFYEDNGLIQADIIAMATTPGASDAWVKTEVPIEASKSNGLLKVGAKGTVEAYVDGADTNNKQVTAVGQIHALAKSETEDTDKSVYGEARIYSGIGEKWDKNIRRLDFQTGSLVGTTPQGAKFYGYANADGKAWYSGRVDLDNDNDGGYADGLLISGSAEGKTTLTGEANGDAGVIADYKLEGPARAVISSNAYTATVDDEQLYKIDSSLNNYISIRASNVVACTNPTAGKVSISGTATGKSDANATAKDITYHCDLDTGACDYTEYAIDTSANKEDSMSADASALKLQDNAGAYAGVNVEGRAQAPIDIANWNTADVLAEVQSSIGTTAEAKRFYAGSDPNGADRTFGKAFITTGKWSAESEAYKHTWEFDPTNYVTNEEWINYTNAGLSGELSQVKDPTVANEYGMGAGAFLQNRKNGPAEATTELSQDAWASGDGGKGTAMWGYAYLAGPASPQWGSSGWDGSGIYKALKNLHVEADPDGFSTDLPTVEAYFWIDGTNDLMKNGPGYSVPVLPTFSPYGAYMQVQWTPFPPSTTERKAGVGMGTKQL